MFNTGVLKETENSRVGCSINKLSVSEKQPPRIKTKALGDVQNTLHSRFGNVVNANFGSGVKASRKFSSYSKPVANEKISSSKNTVSERKVNVTPTKSAGTFFVHSPAVDNKMFEIHNHILCEEDHEFYMNDLIKEYQFSDKQINALVHSVKSFVTPFSFELFEPCEDIDIPDVKKHNEDNFSVSDIFRDANAPAVPAPVETL